MVGWSQWRTFLVALLLSVPFLAHAAASDAPRAAPHSTGTPAGNLDFNLLDDTRAVPKSVEPRASLELERQVRHRRQMLQLHQGLGFATLGLLAITDFVGQLNFDDKFLGGGDSARFSLLHIGLATTTLALFTTTAMLGLFAPTPYAKTFSWDTAFVHKLFMGLATFCMVAQVVLGILSASGEGAVAQRTFVTLHQVSGYTSLGAMAAGATVLFF